MSFTIRKIGDEPTGQRLKKRFLKASAIAVMVTAPLLRLFNVQREIRKEEEQEEKTHGILKKIFLGLLTFLGGLVVLGIVLRILIALNLVSAESFLTFTASPLPVDTHGQTNVLLLGQGDDSHDGVDLTDTIMIGSLDPKTDSAVLLSIPRDLYLVGVEGASNGRINELYLHRKSLAQRQGMSDAEASTQGMKDMAGIIGTLTGIPIHGVVKIDFIGFVQAVDAIGGVTIDVPYTIVDREYPAERGYGYQTFMITEGPHKLDGATALKYARSRHTTSDFGRSARQQQLISTMVHQMKEDGTLSSPGTIMDLWAIAGEHVATTFTFGEIAGLAKLGKSLNRENILSMQLHLDPSSAGGFLYPPPREQFGGASVLLPVSVSGSPGWGQIASFLDLLLHHRNLYFPKPVPVEIRNVSARTGSAQLIAYELSRYGLDIISSKNAPEEMRDQTLPASQIFYPPAEEERAAYLSELLKIPAAKTETPLISDVGTGSVLILLGEDYTYTPIQTLLPIETP